MASILKICSVVLVGARAAAINGGGFPLSKFLPFQHSSPPKVDIPPNAGLTKAADDDAAMGNGLGDVAEVAEKHALHHVAEALRGIVRPSAEATSASADSTASKPKNGKTSGSKLLERKKALLKSSSVALKHYERARADEDALFQVQRKRERMEEHANMNLETEIAKLRDVKKAMVQAARESVPVSPLEDSYTAAREKVARAEAHVVAEENRVSDANSKAVTILQHYESAAESLQQAAEESAKRKEEVRTALQGVVKLLAKIRAAQKLYSGQVQMLDGYAKELESQDAALMVAISNTTDLSVAALSDAEVASAAPAAKHPVAQEGKGQAVLRNVEHASAAPAAKHPVAHEGKGRAAVSDAEGASAAPAAKHPVANEGKGHAAVSDAEGASAAPAAKHPAANEGKGRAAVSDAEGASAAPPAQHPVAHEGKGRAALSDAEGASAAPAAKHPVAHGGKDRTALSDLEALPVKHPVAGGWKLRAATEQDSPNEAASSNSIPRSSKRAGPLPSRTPATKSGN